MADSLLRQRRKAQSQQIKAVLTAKKEKPVWKRPYAIGAAFLVILTSLIIYSGELPEGFYEFFRSAAEKERRELKRREPEVIADLVSNSPHNIGQFCDSSNDCFIVHQFYWSSEGRLRGQRLIQYELNLEMALTVADLKAPEIVTHDHEAWKVDHSRLRFSYNFMQIAAGFMLEGLTPNSSTFSSQRILQIGMGGGSASGFLAQLPLDLELDVVELEQSVYESAKKWFDFPEGPKIRVHIEDGVDFVRRAAKEDAVYDSVILDASSNAPDAEITCPHEVFQKEEVIKDMSKIIGSTGVFSMNMFMHKEQLRLQEDMIRLFSHYFASCSAPVFSHTGQKFLMCTNRPDFNMTTQRDRIFANLRQFDKIAGTESVKVVDRYNPIDRPGRRM